MRYAYKSQILAFIFSIIAVPYSAFAGGSRPLNVEYISYESTNGTTKITVPGKSGVEAPSVFASGNNGGGVFATGQAARNLAEGHAALERSTAAILENKKVLDQLIRDAQLAQLEKEAKERAAKQESLNPPPAGKKIVIQSDGKFSGGLFEFKAESGAFAAARHTLQGQKQSDIEAAFKSAGLKLDDFSLFGAWEGSEPLDTVLFIPKKKIYDWLSLVPQKNCTDEFPLVYELRELSAELQKTISAGMNFHSTQLGMIGQKQTEQTSQGKVGVVGVRRFYLPYEKENYTTVGSSGSAIQINDGQSGWKLGGFVECIIPARRTLNKVEIPGGVQVISIGALSGAIIIPESLESVLREVKTIDPECVPVDPRGAGGERKED